MTSRDMSSRSKNMSAIHNKDTNIELKLRKELWRQGLRYRKNYLKLPGKPDIVFTKKKIVIFCDSEFWHGKLMLESKMNIHTNPEYWIPKIKGNIRRDGIVNDELKSLGYFVIRFWGKEILNDLERCVDYVLEIYNSR